jgi:hypothetical protein
VESVGSPALFLAPQRRAIRSPTEEHNAAPTHRRAARRFIFLIRRNFLQKIAQALLSG